MATEDLRSPRWFRDDQCLRELLQLLGGLVVVDVVVHMEGGVLRAHGRDWMRMMASGERRRGTATAMVERRRCGGR